MTNPEFWILLDLLFIGVPLWLLAFTLIKANKRTEALFD